MVYKNFKQKKKDNRQIAEERIEVLEGMIAKKPEFEAGYRRLIKRLRDKYRLHKDF